MRSRTRRILGEKVDCKQSTNLAVIHFSLTARFLSVYAKKTNLAVNHFSLTANFFSVYIKEYKSRTFWGLFIHGGRGPQVGEVKYGG